MFSGLFLAVPSLCHIFTSAYLTVSWPFPVPCPEAVLQWASVTVCSPRRLKVEELEAERSRLEEEKKALEAQLERLTLQVSLSKARPPSCEAPAPQPSTSR